MIAICSMWDNKKALALAIAFYTAFIFPALAGEERLAGAKAAASQNAVSQTESYGGREYDLHLPKGLKPGQKVPLVIVLHGGGGSKNYAHRNLNMDEAADKRGFMVAYLNGNPGPRALTHNLRTWNGGGCCGKAVEDNADDVSYIDGFIKEMISTRKADPARIYITGHSNGAIMAYRFACERPGRVAAIVPISGTLFIDHCTAPDLRVLHIHGENDQHVLPGGGYGPKSIAKVNFPSIAWTKKMLEDAGAMMQVKMVPGGPHDLDGLNEILVKTESKKLADIIASFFVGQ